MIQYVTQEAFDQMKSQLQQMKTVDRINASKAIAEAREKGDLKENAEYDAAKEAQGILEAKIIQLESLVAASRVIDASQIDTSKASILTKVTITNLNTKKQMTYQLVSEKEADLKVQKISINSPIGQGLLGRKVGEEVEIIIPAGKLKFKIDNISI